METVTFAPSIPGAVLLTVRCVDALGAASQSVQARVFAASAPAQVASVRVASGKWSLETDEDCPLSIGSAWVVTGARPLALKLKATPGSLTRSAANGSSSSPLELRGTAFEVALMLQDVLYFPPADYCGLATVSATVDAWATSSRLVVRVRARPDAPKLSAPATLETVFGDTLSLATVLAQDADARDQL